MDQFATAETTVVLRMDAETAKHLMAGIRRFHAGWLKSLSKEEAERPIEVDVRVARHLPNHIARALEDAAKKIADGVKVEL